MFSTVGGRAFAVRRTGLETKSSCVDPHNVPDTGMLDYQQVNDMERLGRVSCAGNDEVYCLGRNREFRRLCGST